MVMNQAFVGLINLVRSVGRYSVKRYIVVDWDDEEIKWGGLCL